MNILNDQFAPVNNNLQYNCLFFTVLLAINMISVNNTTKNIYYITVMNFLDERVSAIFIAIFLLSPSLSVSFIINIESNLAVRLFFSMLTCITINTFICFEISD